MWVVSGNNNQLYNLNEFVEIRKFSYDKDDYRILCYKTTGTSPSAELFASKSQKTLFLVYAALIKALEENKNLFNIPKFLHDLNKKEKKEDNGSD